MTNLMPSMNTCLPIYSKYYCTRGKLLYNCCTAWCSIPGDKYITHKHTRTIYVTACTAVYGVNAYSLLVPSMCNTVASTWRGKVLYLSSSKKKHRVHAKPAATESRRRLSACHNTDSSNTDVLRCCLLLSLYVKRLSSSVVSYCRRKYNPCSEYNISIKRW